MPDSRSIAPLDYEPHSQKPRQCKFAIASFIISFSALPVAGAIDATFSPFPNKMADTLATMIPFVSLSLAGLTLGVFARFRINRSAEKLSGRMWTTAAIGLSMVFVLMALIGILESN